MLCDITFVNPTLDKAFEDGNVTEEEYKNNAPSFKALDIPFTAQGTSSLTYPRKNFKGKLKNALREDDDDRKSGDFYYTHDKLSDNNKEARKKYFIKNGMGETTFTWKADFMDSSSCHNTGFASFAHELYWNHPLDYYNNFQEAENRLGSTATGPMH
jgi:hypothetical protein